MDQVKEIMVNTKQLISVDIFFWIDGVFIAGTLVGERGHLSLPQYLPSVLRLYSSFPLSLVTLVLGFFFACDEGL